MADNGHISYSDIVSPDNSISDLVKQLGEANKTYEDMARTIIANAEKMAKALEAVSGATKMGREQLVDAEKATDALSEAYKQLALAESAIGKEIAVVNSLTAERNKMSVEQSKAFSSAKGSYEQLNSALKLLVGQYKALSQSERENSQQGKDLLASILSYKDAIAQVTAKMKPHVQQLTEQQKIERQEIQLQDKLRASLSAQGQAVAELKAKISDANKKTVEDMKLIEAQSGSYQELTLVLKKLTDRYKALSEADRTGQRGQDLLDQIKSRQEAANAIKEQLKFSAADSATSSTATGMSFDYAKGIDTESASLDSLREALKVLKSEYSQLGDIDRSFSEGLKLSEKIVEVSTKIKELDDTLRPHQQQMTEEEKLTQRLNDVRSDEGKAINDLKQQLAMATEERKREWQETNRDAIIQAKIADAKRRLAEAQSDENVELKALNKEVDRANRLANLQARLATSVVGSYDNMAAQYEINKIKLEGMTAAERESTAAGQDLVEQTKDLYNRMTEMREAIGDYRNNVGHYEKAWDSLGYSMAQLVREVPNAFVSLNTFFLSISNNLPVLGDEIAKLRKENEALAKEGKKTKPIMNSLFKSLMTWNTALVAAMAVLMHFAPKIQEWVTKQVALWKGYTEEVVTYRDLIKEVSEGMDKSGLGKMANSVEDLSREWRKLSTEAEKLRYLDIVNSRFKEYGLAIDDVNKAEKILIEHKADVIKALMERGKAMAAQKVAAKYIESLVSKQLEFDIEFADGLSEEDIKDRTAAMKAGFEIPEEDIESAKRELRMIKASLSQSDLTKGSGVEIIDVSDEEAYDLAVKRYLERKSRYAKVLENDTKTLEDNTRKAFALVDKFSDSFAEKAKSLGFKQYTGKGSGDQGRKPTDLTDTILKNQIKAQKEYEKSVTALLDSEWEKKRKSAEDQVENENAKLREMLRKNEEYVNNVGGKYKKLTDEQKALIEQQNDWINKTIDNNLELLDKKLDRIMKERQLATAKIMREGANSVTAATPMGNISEDTLALEGSNVELGTKSLEARIVKERKLQEMIAANEYEAKRAANKQLQEAGKDYQTEEELLIQFQQKRKEIWAKYDLEILEMRKQDIEDQLAVVEKNSEFELTLIRLRQEAERKILQTKNAAAPAAKQVSSASINEKQDKKDKLEFGARELRIFEETQAMDKAKYETGRHTSENLTRYQLTQERDLWKKKIELARKGGLDWSEEQIKAAEYTLAKTENELDKVDTKRNSLLDKLGFDDESLEAAGQAASFVVDQIKSIMDAEAQAAEASVQAQEKRVAAAEKAYDAEIELRNNGYANNVATAKKELQQEKKKQEEKQKLLEAAQRRQQAVDSVMQVSSLVTASANIWKSLSAVPVIGPALAAAALGAMWASFAVAKVKAKQAAVQEYGEGGLEFLEGGSHASGHDIDLGVSNKRRKRMRAEGGEALAIINKKRTRKYRGILPDVIESLNKGTFEEKYMNAFAGGSKMVNINFDNRTDLSRIERDVQSIREQSETKYYNLPDGSVVMQKGNVKRIIRKQ